MSIIDQIHSGTTVPADLRRRFGYSAGVPNLTIDGKKSGLKCNPIDGGVLLPFYAGKDGYKGGLKPDGSYQQVYVDILPAEYAYRVDKLFHQNIDAGYRNLEMLTDLPYEMPPPRPSLPRVVDGNTRRQDGYELSEHNKRMNAYHELYNDEWYKQNDLAYAYFNVVHPVLTSCEFGLNQRVQLNDPGVQPGELFYQHCPSCRLAHLRSDACAEAIYTASVAMDSKILADLRSVLISANEAALSFIQAQQAMVAGDIANRMTGSANGRSNLNAIDRIHLKMLHKTESAQVNTQTEMVRTLAQEMAAAFRSSAPIVAEAPVAEAPVEATPTLTPEEIAEYHAYKARKEQMAKAREAKNKTEENNG